MPSKYHQHLLLSTNIRKLKSAVTVAFVGVLVSEKYFACTLPSLHLVSVILALPSLHLVSVILALPSLHLVSVILALPSLHPLHVSITNLFDGFLVYSNTLIEDVALGK